MDFVPFSGFDHEIDTIFFDAGNTLITWAVDGITGFIEIAKRNGCEVSREKVMEVVDIVDVIYHREATKDYLFWSDSEKCVNLWLEMYTELCKSLGFGQKAQSIARDFYDEFMNPAIWRCFDDVIPALHAFKDAGKKLAVISNWDYGLEEILNHTGAGQYMDMVFQSARLKLAKPSPEIYHYALEHMEADASTSLMIGDNIMADCFGSRAVGLEGCHIRHVGHSMGVSGAKRDMEDTCSNGAQMYASGKEAGIVYISHLTQLIPFVC